MPSGSISKSDEQFQAEQDVRTLIEAAKLKGDKKRLDRAMKEARSQMKALEEVDR
ncbi:MAG: hypothetical protein ACR2QF_04195 [Geminicoccaceae bacterium]